VAFLHIRSGRRPEKPIFIVTRGYTEELWGITESCWKQDPDERPTVDQVLDTLRGGAKGWKAKYGEFSTPSPVDDWSLTPLTEGPDSPTVSGYENAPVTTTAPLSRKVPQAPAIKTPVPAPTQARPPHSVLYRPFHPRE
jgi:hypothetical protein